MLPTIAPVIISVGKWLPDAYLKYPTADESSNDVPQIYGVRLESGLYLLNVVDRNIADAKDTDVWAEKNESVADGVLLISSVSSLLYEYGLYLLIKALGRWETE